MPEKKAPRRRRPAANQTDVNEAAAAAEAKAAEEIAAAEATIEQARAAVEQPEQPAAVDTAADAAPAADDVQPTSTPNPDAVITYFAWNGGQRDVLASAIVAIEDGRERPNPRNKDELVRTARLFVRRSGGAKVNMIETFSSADVLREQCAKAGLTDVPSSFNKETGAASSKPAKAAKAAKPKLSDEERAAARAQAKADRSAVVVETLTKLIREMFNADQQVRRSEIERKARADGLKFSGGHFKAALEAAGVTLVAGPGKPAGRRLPAPTTEQLAEAIKTHMARFPGDDMWDLMVGVQNLGYSAPWRDIRPVADSLGLKIPSKNPSRHAAAAGLGPAAAAFEAALRAAFEAGAANPKGDAAAYAAERAASYTTL